jgi:ABC-type transport system involved in multi-copper enzyme maturation permease subunit
VNPEIRNLDLSDLPAFSFHARSIAEKMGSALSNILILIFYNLAFFLLAHFSFNRYDPRKDA